jgi:LPS export ABC transporter protein LptC
MKIIDIGAIKVTNSGIILDKVQYTEAKDGKIEWRLEADSASYLRKENITVFKNVKVEFYSRNGRVYTMTGAEGRFDGGSRDIEMFGNVLVVSDDGYRLKTNSLKYNASEREISTKDNISLASSNMNINGIGLIIYIDKDSLSVLDDVRTVLKYVLI